MSNSLKHLGKTTSECCQCKQSRWRCSVKKGDLKNFTKFLRKHLCESLVFNTVAGVAWTLAQVFSYKFCKVFKNTYFIEYLPSYWAFDSIILLLTTSLILLIRSVIRLLSFKSTMLLHIYQYHSTCKVHHFGRNIASVFVLPITWNHF